MEEQQAENPATKPGGKTPATDADRTRQRQSLELQRERILDERTSSPIRRKALEAALTEIEAKLTQL